VTPVMPLFEKFVRVNFSPAIAEKKHVNLTVLHLNARTWSFDLAHGPFSKHFQGY